jgi:hypothetical protein
MKKKPTICPARIKPFFNCNVSQHAIESDEAVLKLNRQEPELCGRNVTFSGQNAEF